MDDFVNDVFLVDLELNGKQFHLVNKKMNWNDAVSYANSLGKGWAIPTKKQWEIIINYKDIDTESLFKTKNCWSSEYDDNFAWRVLFGMDACGLDSKSDIFDVVLMRKKR